MLAPNAGKAIIFALALETEANEVLKAPITGSYLKLTRIVSQEPAMMNFESIFRTPLGDQGINVDQSADALLSMTVGESGQSTCDMTFDFRPAHLGPDGAFFAPEELSDPNLVAEMQHQIEQLLKNHGKQAVLFNTVGHLFHADFLFARLDRQFQRCSVLTEYGSDVEATECWQIAKDTVLETQKLTSKSDKTENSEIALAEASVSDASYTTLFLKQPYLCSRTPANRTNFLLVPKADFSYFLSSLSQNYRGYQERQGGKDWSSRHLNLGLLWTSTVDDCILSENHSLDPRYAALLLDYIRMRVPHLARFWANGFANTFSNVLRSPDRRVFTISTEAVNMLNVILKTREAGSIDMGSKVDLEAIPENAIGDYLRDNALNILRVPELQMLWLATDAAYNRVTMTQRLMSSIDLYNCITLDAAQSRIYDSGSIVGDGLVWCSESPAERLFNAKDARISSLKRVSITIAEAAKRMAQMQLPTA